MLSLRHSGTIRDGTVSLSALRRRERRDHLRLRKPRCGDTSAKSRRGPLLMSHWSRCRGVSWEDTLHLLSARFGVVFGLVTPVQAEVALHPLHPLEVVAVLATAEVVYRDRLQKKPMN